MGRSTRVNQAFRIFSLKRAGYCEISLHKTFSQGLRLVDAISSMRVFGVGECNGFLPTSEN